MRRAFKAIGLSVGAHALVVIGLMQVPTPPPLPSAPDDAVTFRVTSDAAPAPGRSEAPSPEAAARAPRVSRARRRRPEARSSPDGVVQETPEESQGSEVPSSGSASAGSEAAPRPGLPGGRAIDLAVRPPGPPTTPPGLVGIVAPPPAPPMNSKEPVVRGPGRYANNRVEGHIRADGTLGLDSDARAGLAVRNGGPALVFDPTEELMRLVGDDPVAYDKSKFEKQTRALRNELRDEACRADLQAALLEVGPRLEHIWADSGRSAPARRRAVFQVWNECAEDGPPEVIAAASQIREKVLDFIAQHMPPGTAYAYTDEEIRRLNATRLGRQIFAPYEAGP